MTEFLVIPVRYLRTIFVPVDETCFLREAARRVHLHVERLVETSEHLS